MVSTLTTDNLGSEHAAGCYLVDDEDKAIITSNMAKRFERAYLQISIKHN